MLFALIVENVVLFMDLFVYPDVYLTPVHTGAALAGSLLLLFGLIWETK